MRPLAVLSLILLAVGALFFALMSVLGQGERGTVVEPSPLVKPAQGEPGSDGDLTAPVDTEVAVSDPAPRKELPQATEQGLAASGHIRGVVVGPDGAPVDRAQVFLRQEPGGPSSLSEALEILQEVPRPAPKKQSTTDTAGRFRFDGLTAGRDWTVEVKHELYTVANVGPIEVPEEGGTEERIELEFGLELFGVVSEAETGAPIEGARVVLDSPLAAFLPSTRESPGRIEVASDATGRYELANVGTGQKVLIVSAPGYATEMHSNVLDQIRAGATADPTVWHKNRQKQLAGLVPQPKEPQQFDVELEPGQAIAGRVLGPDRAGIASVPIEALSQSGEIGSRGSATSTAEGEFLIEGLAAGIYTVRAELSGFECTPLQRVEAGTTDLEIVLAEQGSVTGRVVDATTGEPVTSFTCRVRTLHPRNITWGGIVAKQNFRDRSNGAFALSGISEGDFIVEAFAKGYASSFSEPFHVTQGVETQNVEVRLTRGGTIKGSLVDSYSGQPVAGALVKTNDNNYVDAELMQIFNAISQSASTKTSVRTGDDGQFELTLLTPDSYQVQIEKPGYASIMLNDIKVADGLTTELGVQALTKGAIVRGNVYGPEGETIAGATVVLTPSDNDLWSGRNGRTDANGHYVLRNAKPGTYKLYASRPVGTASNPFAPAIDMNQSSVEITVADGGTYDQDLHLGPRN